MVMVASSAALGGGSSQAAAQELTTNERRAAASAPVAVPGPRAMTRRSPRNVAGGSRRWLACDHPCARHQQIIRGMRRGTLMRHVLLCAIATGTRGMDQAAPAARLVALAGRTLRVAPG